MAALFHQRIKPTAAQPGADFFDAAADIVRMARSICTWFFRRRPRAERAESWRDT